MDDSNAEIFFMALKELNTLKLIVPVSDHIFDTICSNSSNLEFLHIVISSMNVPSYVSLSALKKLRELHIEDSRQDCELMKNLFNNIDLFALKKLSFKSVNLYKSTFCDIAKCAPSLLKLIIEDFQFNDDCLESFCKELSFLTHLKLELVTVRIVELL